MADAAAESMQSVATAWKPRYPMARLSSWRAGGVASWLFTPQGIAEGQQDNPMLTLPYAMPPQVWLQPGNEAPLFVGHGSNLLVRDGGYDGIVVHTAVGLGRMDYEAKEGGVYAGSGVSCPKLARFCANYGLDAGFFVGIPGTVGGALAMNAGCHGHETWQYVDRVVVICGGAIKQLPAEVFTVRYRHVSYLPFDEKIYFVAAYFRFPASDEQTVRRKIKTLLQQRAAAQPLGNACAGSVFRNPPGDYAGRLIEQCGLKGKRIGGAVVSDKHANFILNDRGATAADIESLARYVQSQVEEKTGIHLELEVQIVGAAA